MLYTDAMRCGLSRAVRAIAVVAMLAGLASPAFAQNQGKLATTWWERAHTFQTQHYDVKTDLADTTATALGWHMDVMFDRYVDLFAGYRQNRNFRLLLLLFERREDYIATMKNRYDADVMGTGGVCVDKGSIVVLAAWRGGRSLSQVKSVLQHEGFHQFAAAFFGDMPPWTNEGVAELCGDAVVMGDKVIFGEVTKGRLEFLRSRLEAGQLWRQRDLFQLSSDRLVDHVNAGNGAVEYAQSWLTVHYMGYGEDARHQQTFFTYLGNLNRGRSWESAFSSAFQTNRYQELEQPLIEHLASLQPTDYRETARRLDFLAAGLAALAQERVEVRTLAELKEKLRERKFSYTTSVVDEGKTLDASSDEVFRVPLTDAANPHAMFELVTVEATTPTGKGTSKARKPTTTSRSRAKKPIVAKPAEEGDAATEPVAAIMPPRIVTRGLKPVMLEVQWWREERTGDLKYEIVIH